ncbi:RNA polymerase sigma factor [Sphingomonas sp. PAMC 26605]|uniref:RNA polymerase sigma factor n=1 Tax=Sphingomonas sp. PAMC 26605 TaxID=1112214 RepID=UPI00026CB58D|nr:RNA polymerase sigma factor [Sphingomonas sp. PAMC 26605]
MTQRTGDHGRNGDAGIVARLRARDITAFEELYRREHTPLSRFLSNLLRRPYLVEEVVNDTMMVVWDRIDGFAGESRLSTWMFGIAYRQGLSALRRLDEPVEEDPAEMADAQSDGPDRAAGRARVARDLAEAIAQLSAPQRAVVNLTYYQDLGYREIAEIMDCPTDTVKTRMFHARRNLRQSLAGDLADWL